MIPVAPSRIQRLIGVYDADGTLRGELAYWVGARLGRTHCALCDITHGLLRERSEWAACRTGFSVPFDLYHRDDQPESVRGFIGSRLPAVVAETEQGFVLLVGPDVLQGCSGSVEQLVDALTAAAMQCEVSWS